MDQDHHNKPSRLLSVALVLGLLLGGISLLALFAGPLLGLLGFRYESVRSLLAYFILAAGVQILLNLAIGVCSTWVLLLLKLDHRMDRNRLSWFLVLIDVTASILAFTWLDHHMRSVSATPLSIMVLSVILGILGRDEESLPGES